MKSIQIIQDVLLKLLAQNRIAVNVKQRELSKDPLSLAVLARPLVKSGSISERNLQSEIEGAFKYLCEHSLLFFLLMTRKFDVLRKLFQDKSELANIAALRKKIKKRRKLLKEKRAHLFNYSTGLCLVNNQYGNIHSFLEKALYPHEGNILTKKHLVQKSDEIVHYFDRYSAIIRLDKQEIRLAPQRKPPLDIHKARGISNRSCHFRFFVRAEYELEAMVPVTGSALQKFTSKK
jgi:hypothetical protein